MGPAGKSPASSGAFPWRRGISRPDPPSRRSYDRAGLERRPGAVEARFMRSKNSFKEMSPAGRIWTSLLIVASVVLVIAAERDIGRRTAAELRGGKPMWRLLCLNAL